MTSTVYYAGAAELATLTNVFTTLQNGTEIPTDPTSVSLVVTDPAGGQTVYTTSSTPPLVRLSPGKFTIDVPSPLDGLWSYVWTGTGVASDVAPGTWRVHPTGLARLYAGADELRERLGLLTDENAATGGDTRLDSLVIRALRSAAASVNLITGRYFWQAPDTRTYAPEDMWTLRTDDLVSVSQLATDQDGDGIYETVWAGPGTDFQLEASDGQYNPAASGEPWPYTLIRVVSPAAGGKFFPPVWPLSHQDRVKVTGVFGWPAVPFLISEATLTLAIDLFKLKDAPFGVAGFAEYGAVRVRSNPQIRSMIQPYVKARKTVGV